MSAYSPIIIAIPPKNSTPPTKPAKKAEVIPKQKSVDLNYIEIRVNCAECARESRIVVLEGTDTTEWLCPKCSIGDFGDEEEDIG